jgi:hypothetical protein
LELLWNENLSSKRLGSLQKSIEGRWVNRCQTGEFPVKFNSLLQRPLNPMRPGFDDIAEL